MVRADCWPPNTVAVAENTETMAGDIARPVQITNGKRTKITNRYVSRCSTLYDEASASLAGVRRKCLAITIESACRERPVRAGSKFRRKCPLSNPYIM